MYRRDQKEKHAVIEKPPPYLPPSGFELRNIEEASKASKLFSKENLKGKQIFYITAPASVPISSVKKMSLRDAKMRKTAVSHEGDDYAFIEDSSKENSALKVMVPKQSEDGYIAGKLANELYVCEC